MASKNYLVVVRDIIEELSEENDRLLNELKFAHKCLDKLIELKINLVFKSKSIKTNTLRESEWSTIEKSIKEVNEVIAKRDLKPTKRFKSRATQINLLSTKCEKGNEDNDRKIIESEEVEWKTNDDIDDHVLSGEDLTYNDNHDLEVETIEDVDEDYRKGNVNYCKLSHNNYDSGNEKEGPKRTINCTFAACFEKFGQQTDLNKHIDNCHQINKQFVCPNDSCDYRTSAKKLLNSHLIGKHTNQRPFVCPEDNCEVSYAHEKNLKQHIKSHWQPKKSFACKWPGCEYTTDRKNRLINEHMKRHRQRCRK